MGEITQIQTVLNINDVATFCYYSKSGKEIQTHSQQMQQPNCNSEYTWLSQKK